MCDTASVLLGAEIELTETFDDNQVYLTEDFSIEPIFFAVDVKVESAQEVQSNENDQMGVKKECVDTEQDASNASGKVLRRRDPTKRCTLPFHCNLCPERFGDASERARHEQTHLTWHECDACPKRFLTRDHLVCHARTHTGEKPYRCPVCLKRFARTSTLNVHKRIHEEKRPFSCQHCDSSFRHRNTFKLHMAVHTGRSYSCDECGKAFAEKRALRTHLTMHGDKPCACDVCGKRFVCKRTCRIHKAIHDRVKTFTCRECKKSYVMKKELCKHRLLMHKVHACEICTEEFEEKSVLELHLLIHRTCQRCGKVCDTVWKLERHVDQKCSVIV